MFIGQGVPAQAQIVTSMQPASTEQIDSLRQQLIGFLLELIQKLQAQLDAQLAKNKIQDEEITTIKKAEDEKPQKLPKPVIEDKSDPVDEVAMARAKVGEVEATANIEEDNGEYSVAFSITNYLDIDTISFDANVPSFGIEDGCSGIKDSELNVCGTSAWYPIASTSEAIIITVSVNGNQKRLKVPFGKRSLQRVSWPNP